MRLWTATITGRLAENGKTALSINIDLEDGVPEVVLTTIPKLLHKVADDAQKQMDDGTANVVERD